MVDTSAAISYYCSQAWSTFVGTCLDTTPGLFSDNCKKMCKNAVIPGKILSFDQSIGFEFLNILRVLTMIQKGSVLLIFHFQNMWTLEGNVWPHAMVIKVHALTVAQKDCVVHINQDGLILATDAMEALGERQLIYAQSERQKVWFVLIYFSFLNNV